MGSCISGRGGGVSYTTFLLEEGGEGDTKLKFTDFDLFMLSINIH